VREVVLVLLMAGICEVHTIKMGSGAIINLPSFIGSGFQNLLGGDTQTAS
jgi:hypothetical protein